MKNKNEYRYVILDYNGNCWAVKDNATEKTGGLASILAEGWLPIRETPFHSDSVVTPYILILMERDGNGAESGFGFA